MNSGWSICLIALCLPLMTGGCGVPIAVSVASTAADGASYAATNKTGLDHFASMVTKKDCATTRMFQNEKVCRPREDGHDPYDVSYSDSFRTAGEGGVEYSPPLEAAPNAPATSWDAAVYKTPAAAAPATATAPVAAPAASASAQATPAPTPAPAATPTSPAHKKKHAAKKAAPGQVAARP